MELSPLGMWMISPLESLIRCAISPPPAPFCFGALQLEATTPYPLHFDMAGRSKRGRVKNQDESGGGSTAENTGKYGCMFQEFRKQLDAGHDKRERLVKLSRDCTIHSKRAIFTLHQFSGDEDTKERVLGEAEAKFNQDVLPILHSIAEEIGDEDPYRHHRAYSPGVQEFIEALAYYKYLKTGQLIGFSEAQEYLTFQPKHTKDTKPEEVEPEKSDLPKDVTNKIESGSGVPQETSSCNSSNIVLQLTASDFVLGLADLTGELMRLCINSVGSGNTALPLSLLPFFRALFCGFHSSASGMKNMNQKMVVLRSSLGKVEHVCYTLKVRGSEIPKQMLMDAIGSATKPELEA